MQHFYYGGDPATVGTTGFEGQFAAYIVGKGTVSGNLPFTYTPVPPFTSC